MEEPYNPEEKRVASDLAGQTVAYYFRLFRGPVLAVLAAQIVLVILDQKAIYLWFINLLLFIGLTVWLKKGYKGTLFQALILNGSAGLVLGFLLALFKLVWYRQVYLFFNLITETGITFLFGLLIAASTYIVLTREYKEHSILPFKISNKDKELKKGGETNGREKKSGRKPGK